ncbi:RNA exonuclease 4 [Grosmannia clavigera kw1407]|uniref:RNA exonuclease 4 n=1 Tax=Grosmannia clavigera (strain kw1407 / UAMH 11150) TaxID=655863 RepID=F0XRP2_GROCL|nr:RNA exonuclease 4 [Grosmannia clavigera kw1407]EFW99413.1 RNA exonuclease 4 [Grosmannia clavigera kw1407]
MGTTTPNSSISSTPTATTAPLASSHAAKESVRGIAGAKRSPSDAGLDAELAVPEADKKTDKGNKMLDQTVAPIGGSGDDASTGGEWQTIRGGRPTKKLKKVPKKDSGNYPTILFGKNARMQSRIQVSDLRNLVTYIFADGTAPQWVAVNHRPNFRKVVAIMVPGLEEAMFQTDVDFGSWAEKEDGSIAALERWMARQQPSGDDCYPRPLVREKLPAALQPFADVFPHLWPVRARGNEKYATMFSPVATFLTAPLPRAAAEDRDKKAHQLHKDVRTRITEFLATPEEYLSNDFKLHPAMLPDEASRAIFEDMPGWAHTKVESMSAGDVPEAEIEQGSITAGRKVYAVDCEMCKADGNVFVLTRVSVLSWDGEVVMDELVKPDVPIVDYLTQFSGITETMLASVTTTLADIQARLVDLLDAQSILVGHSLDSDMRALQLTHPFVVDTSIAFPHPAGPPKKHALRWLSAKYLQREIQKGHGTAQGHDSIEDARTCLDLMKRKCEKGKLWAAGNQNADQGSEGAGENLFHRLGRAGTAYRSQAGPAATGGLATGKSSAAVDWGDPRRTLCSEAGILLGGCRSDAEVEAAVLRAVLGDPDGSEVPGGGVDFVYARMRGLEALQGWWNRNKLMAGADENQGPPTLGRRVKRIYDQLPPCTAFVLFSGSGDPRAMSRLQAQRAQHKREYHTPGVKWDAITVPWTDTEEQQLRRAVRRAREGVGFMTVK